MKLNWINMNNDNEKSNINKEQGRTDNIQSCQREQ